MNAGRDDAPKSDLAMLLAELPADGMAARLLSIWINSEATERQEKLLEALHPKDEDATDAS